MAEPDAEIEVIRSMLELLEPLADDAKARVLQYALDRLLPQLWAVVASRTMLEWDFTCRHRPDDDSA